MRLFFVFMFYLTNRFYLFKLDVVNDYFHNTFLSVLPDHLKSSQKSEISFKKFVRCVICKSKKGISYKKCLQ